VIYFTKLCIGERVPSPPPRTKISPLYGLNSQKLSKYELFVINLPLNLL